MRYLDVDEARATPGPHLVLTAGVPGPWSMSARSILELKNIAFSPVAQKGGEANEDLVAWTGRRNAPLLLVPGEAGRAHWLEILDWAERAAPEPALLPADPAERALAIGLCDAICSEHGFAWNARLFMLEAMHRAFGDDALASPMLREYGYDPDDLEAALVRVQAVMDLLAGRLRAQEAAGSRYFVGTRFGAADLYWAFFSQLYDALPDEKCPTPLPLRKGWGRFAKRLAATGYKVDPILIEHRDRVFGADLPLPVTF